MNRRNFVKMWIFGLLGLSANRVSGSVKSCVGNVSKDVNESTRETRTVAELMELPVYCEEDILNDVEEFFHREYIFTAGMDKVDFILDAYKKCGFIPIYIPDHSGFDIMKIRLVHISCPS